ncbi:site-specific DNA recombinase [Kitasatospora sp. MAP12-15]|uniref:recombinase family protein n=1 Tax=unclassified Kitasatospora TaxID=2633591 RepID=UPI002476474E|nr:recombinase family protein [Kitasatospora sp. MAP12-44]MDH6108871.1 site-specific DNA recombinase [Kitasatospora sp. MAP12-44]
MATNAFGLSADETAAPVTPYDGCGKCLLGVRRLSRVKGSTSSPTKQRDQILKAAGEEGAHIIGWADDWEVSGASDPHTRPQLGPWLAGKRGPYDGLAASAVDRIGRDVAEGLNLARENAKAGRRLLTADHPGWWNLSDVNDELNFNIKLLGAQIEHRNIKKRNQDESTRARDAGKIANQCSYGYQHIRRSGGKVEGREFEPTSCKEIRKTAKRILADKTGKITPWTEARRMTRAGILSPMDWRAVQHGREPKGLAWSAKGLIVILTSEAALGYLMHAKRPVLGADGKPVKVGPALWDRATHEALVKKCAAKPASVPRRRAPKSINRLTGVGVCGQCREPLQRSGTVGPKGKTEPAYACTGRSKGLPQSANCRPAPIIGVRRLDSETEVWFLARYGSGQLMERVYDSGTAYASQIKELEANRARLRADRDAGLYDSADDSEWFRTRYVGMGEEIEKLKKLPERPAGWHNVPTGKTVADEWHAGDDVAKREMLEEHGVRVELFPRSAKKQIVITAEIPDSPGAELVTGEADHQDATAVPTGEADQDVTGDQDVTAVPSPQAATQAPDGITEPVTVLSLASEPLDPALAA